jgi:general secretion pathway protein D
VTQVIRLDNISAAKLIPVLRPLVPQQAHMAAYAPSNAIIISDIRIQHRSHPRNHPAHGQVRRAGDRRRHPLRYGGGGRGRDAGAPVQERSKQKGDPENEVIMVADKRTNSVLITGDELTRAADAQAGAAPRYAAGAERQRQGDLPGVRAARPRSPRC